jgi:putative oxidoreductase
MCDFAAHLRDYVMPHVPVRQWVLTVPVGLMSGLGTRLISVPFIVEMVVAMLSTKVALFLGTSPLPKPPSPPQVGLSAVLHEIRSDYAQIMSCIYLLAAGPGLWSLDALLAKRRRAAASPAIEGSPQLDAARA